MAETVAIPAWVAGVLSAFRAERDGIYLRSHNVKIATFSHGIARDADDIAKALDGLHSAIFDGEERPS